MRRKRLRADGPRFQKHRAKAEGRAVNLEVYCQSSSSLHPSRKGREAGTLFLGEAHLFEGVGSENAFRELGQPVERADRLDLLPHLFR